MEVIDKVGGSDTESSHMELHKLFNEQGYSDYVVVYLRLITSGQLQRDADFYQHFIEGERTIMEFCHQVYILTIDDLVVYIVIKFLHSFEGFIPKMCSFVGSRTNVQRI